MAIEIGRLHVVNVEAGAAVPPEGHQLYARDTDKLYKSNGSSLTELASGGAAYTDEQAQDAVGAMVDTSLTYTDATPLLKVTALSGDVTSTGANVTTIANNAVTTAKILDSNVTTAKIADLNVTTGKIADDAVTYAKIQNVTDARVLGRSAGSSGDAQEITVGSSLSLSSGSLALPSWRNKYDPMRPPTSVGTGGIQDEFIGGVTMTFTGWQNQESATATAARDGLVLYHPADATGFSAYYFTGPDGASTNWTFHVKLSTGLQAGFNRAGIGVLATGTEASPTLLYQQELLKSTVAPLAFTGSRSYTSYTSAATTLGVDRVAPDGVGFLAIDYISSTKLLSFMHSVDGYMYYTNATVTLAAHPKTSFYLFISCNNATYDAYGFYHFVRLRTDASRLNPGE